VFALDDRTGNILTTIAVYAAVVVAAFLTRSTLGVFLLALLLAYLLEPIVAGIARLMSRSSHGRAIAIAVVYAGLTALTVVVGYAFGSPVAAQVRRFVAAIPDITGRLDKALPGGHTDLVSPVVARATGAVVNAAEGIAWLLLVPIVAIFFLGNRSGLLQRTADLFGRGSDVAAAKRTIDQVDRALAEYARAQLILATLSGIFYASATALLGFPYPLALGALGGALEFVPAFGWIAAAVAILVTGWAAHAHWIAMAVLIGVWRLVQNFVNSPLVMSDHLQMNPMLVLFAMMAGGQLGGLTGIVISLPAIAVARILWAERRAASSQSNIALFKS